MVCCSDNSFWINYTLYLISWRTTVQEPRSGPCFCNSMITASMCVGDRNLSCCLSCHVICRCASWSNIAADGPCAMIVWVARPRWWWSIVVDIIIIKRLHRALLIEGVSVAWGLLPMWGASIRQKVCLWRGGGVKKVETCRVIWSGGVSKGLLLLLLLLFYEASHWILMLQFGPTAWGSQWWSHIVVVPEDMILIIRTALHSERKEEKCKKETRKEGRKKMIPPWTSCYGVLWWIPSRSLLCQTVWSTEGLDCRSNATSGWGTAWLDLDRSELMLGHMPRYERSIHTALLKKLMMHSVIVCMS